MRRFRFIALSFALNLAADIAVGFPVQLSLTNAESRVTRFGVDAQGRVKTVTNALNQVATFRYDAGGNLTNRTDAAGVATRYLYDGINRLTNIVYASTGQKTILRYDANSNLTNAWATNSTAFAKVANVVMRYDNRDRLTNATTTAGSATWSVGYRHDLNGNTTNIVYPGGNVVTYAYDAQDRCTSVTDWLGRQTQFGYDNASRLTSITYPAANGVTATYGYDAMGRRTSYSYAKGGNTLASRALTRNALGYKIQENVNAGYAPVPATQKLRSSTFDTADRFTGSTDTPGGSIAYGFDAKGNLTNVVSSTTTNRFVWNDDNRLKSATNNASAVDYLYDALGTRIGTLTSTTTNYFTVNQSAGLKNVLVEMNGAGTAQRYYVWGPAGLVCQIESDGTTHYVHPDEQGSTLLLTDASGNVTDQFAYTPYGELINRTGSTTTPYKWLGGVAVRDEGNALYFMLNRYYSSDQKRFLSQDPSGIDSGPNLYAYANLNPVFFVDPYGLFGWTNVAGGLRAVGGGFEAIAGYSLAAAGVTFGTVTSPTVGGAVLGFGAAAGGVVVGGHGIDQVQAGVRQLFSGNQVDSLTSHGLQAAGMSQNAANLTDAGISVVGSFGAGYATAGLRASTIAATDPLAQGLSRTEILTQWERGSKALNNADFFDALAGDVTSPLFRAPYIEAWVDTAGNPLTTTALQGFGKSIQLGYTGLTPMAAQGAGYIREFERVERVIERVKP